MKKSKKAMEILIHPLTIGAISIYALNIFVLQPFVPSWGTGKLGDFAWLFFFPYIATVLLALLLPGGREDRAFTLAVLVTGAGFALAKTTVFNQWLVQFFQGMLRQPVTVAKDPSDLLALLSLPGSIWLWRKYRPAPASTRKTGLLILPLAMFLMLADSAMPDFGLTYLEAHGNTILACSNYGSYQSTDGGMSWAGVSYDSGVKDCALQPQGNGSIVDPTNDGIQYRYRAYTIERSTDGGKTWLTDYSWRPLNQAEQDYFETTHQNYGQSSGIPRYAVGDPATGNIIFAMGPEGALVRQAGTRGYSWVSVGAYQRIKISKTELVANLLTGEWFLALIAGGLGITLLSLRVRKSVVKIILLILAILGWLVITWITPPALTFMSAYLGMITASGLLLVGVITFVLTIVSFIQVGMKAKALLGKFALALLGIISLFITPYILWALNLIKDYYFAAGAASLLSVGFLISQWVLAPEWIRSKAGMPSGQA
jgi:hypothetical protein